MTQVQVEIAAATTLRISRRFAAPRDRVFWAWTEPGALAVWWWPWSPTVAIDLRPGGTYRYTADHPQGGTIAISGEFLVVEPPARLVYTWIWDGEVRGTRVTVEVHERGEETELVLEHAGFDTPEARDSHGIGWNDCMDRLTLIVAAQS